MTFARQRDDQFSTGLTGAVVLHLALLAALAAAAFLGHSHSERWGEHAASVGAIQASMVNSIPLPPKAVPVEKSVLTAEYVTPTPAPPPKAATLPPPKPTDILIKAKAPVKPPVVKTAPVEAPAPPKHPQPTPETPKAASGEAATQLPESVSQIKNGSAAATIEDKAFGTRYAYYRDVVSRTVSQNWYTTEADPRTSQGKHVVVIMDIQRDGTPTNIRIETHSGSPSLDTSALRALQRIDTFGPLPAGDHVTVELSFDYHQP